jgi:hypothetical protein
MSEQQPLIAPLERLGLEVERMAHAAERAPRRRLRAAYARRPGLVIALVLLLLLAAAAALAASGLLSGAPVRDPAGFVYKPDQGLGTVVPGSARLTSLRVADPLGGPPWGIRTVRTTRRFGCVQIGRVVRGRLGAIGQDGLFANDGKFHELPPRVLSQAQCWGLDVAGHAFIAVSASGLPASGFNGGCMARAFTPGPGLPFRNSTKKPPALCPHADLRNIAFGTLGPQGRAVDYEDPATGRIVRQKAAGPDHAYLVVTRPTAKHPGLGQWFTTATPGSGFKAIHYADGSTCRVTSGRFAGGSRPCPAKGYVAAPLTAASVRATVTASVGPQTIRTADGRTYHRRAITLSFVAPVATPDASMYYTVSAITRSVHGFGKCGLGGEFGAVERAVRKGERVVEHLSAVKPTCPYAIDVAVHLHRQGPKDTDAEPYAGSRSASDDPLVGRATVRP